MKRAAVIFPGQGAQSVGMGRDVYDASVAARRVYERASTVLALDLVKLCFEGPPSELERTDVQQPAIFVTSVAIWEALLESGGRREWFDKAAGLSLGEYTALYIAGAVSWEDALRLVRRRGELMQQAALASPSGMVSLVGADATSARALCDEVREVDVLAPANFNCPGQVVISGSQAACERATAAAPRFGLRAVPLAVAGAFHSPLMAPAARGLSTVLQETPLERPSIPVISNVDAEYHGDAVAIRDRLTRQLTHPVLWQRCVERMMTEGARHFVEIGPGRVLTGLLRKIRREVTVTNISTMDGLHSAVENLRSS